MKKIVITVLALVLLLAFSVPALAASSPDREGWYSAPVLEDSVTWLTVDTMDPAGDRNQPANLRLYFGIMNGRTVATNELIFETGSTFSVRALTPGSPEYEKAFNSVDEQTAKNVGKNILLFEVKITGADGSEYTVLRGLSDLIVRGRYGVIGIFEGVDETVMTTVKMLSPGWMNAPEEGEYTFCILNSLTGIYGLIPADAEFSLNAFLQTEDPTGGYGVYNPSLPDEDTPTYPGPGQGNYPASTISNGCLAIITGIIGIAVGMAVMFLIMRKKKAVPAKAADSEE